MLTIIKNHRFRLTFASLILLISLIYGLPNIYLTYKLGKNYSSPLANRSSSIGTDESTLYAPAVNYISQDHVFLKDVYVAEYANYPTPFIGESAPSIVMAILAYITGTIDNAFIAADFIFPALIFALLYVFSSHFIKSGYFALITSFTASISRDFIATVPNPFSIIDYLKYGDSHNEFLYLSRSFHPQISFIFFLSSMTLLLHLIKKPALKTSIILGISFGLLFYTYIFYWTYFLVFITLVFIYFTFKKDFKIVKLLIISVLIGISFGLYYFQNIFNFYSLSIASDFTEKFTVTSSPIPLTLFRHVFIAILLWLVISAKDRKNIFLKKELKYFYVALILVGIFFPLASKIIGKDLETLHYIRRGLMPFTTVALFITIYYFFKNNKYFLKSFITFIFAGFLFFALTIQVRATKNIQFSEAKGDDQKDVLGWFKHFTPKNSVIGSLDTCFNMLIPVYTNNKVYFPPTYRSITPTYEENERYAILSNLLGIDPSDQKKDLEKIASYVFSFKAYNQKKRTFEIDPKRKILAETQLDVLSRIDIKSLIRRYQIDYMVVRADYINNTNPHFELLKPLTSVNGYVIFKVI